MEKSRLRTISDIVTTLEAAVILIVILLTAGSIVWAILEDAKYLVIPIGVVTFASGLSIFSWVKGYKERRNRNFATMGDERIETTIHNWLDVPYFSVQRQAYPGNFFQFDVTGKSGIPVSVQRQRADPNVLSLGVRVTWGDEDKLKLRNLPEPIGSNLITQLRIEMLRLGIQFSMRGQRFDEILLVEEVALDNSLSSLYFLQRIFFVVRASSMVKEVSQLTMLENPSSESTSGKKGSRK